MTQLYIVGVEGSLEVTDRKYMTEIGGKTYARFKTQRHAMWTFRVSRGVCIEDRTTLAFESTTKRILAREVPGEATFAIEEIEARIAKAREAVRLIECERTEMLDALAPRCKVARAER